MAALFPSLVSFFFNPFFPFSSGLYVFVSAPKHLGPDVYVCLSPYLDNKQKQHNTALYNIARNYALTTTFKPIRSEFFQCRTAMID